jgi:hypothetical protein
VIASARGFGPVQLLDVPALHLAGHGALGSRLGGFRNRVRAGKFKRGTRGP